MPVVLDTSVVIALTLARDPQHKACKTAIQSERESIIIPQAILPEVGWLIRSRIGAAAEAAFFESLLTSGWTAEPLTESDMSRVAELLKIYQDAAIGFVDAAVVALAERVGARTIYTLDRRDFSLVRPRHAESFALLP